MEVELITKFALYISMYTLSQFSNSLLTLALKGKFSSTSPIERENAEVFEEQSNQLPKLGFPKNFLKFRSRQTGNVQRTVKTSTTFSIPKDSKDLKS